MRRECRPKVAKQLLTEHASTQQTFPALSADNCYVVPQTTEPTIPNTEKTPI